MLEIMYELRGDCPKELIGELQSGEFEVLEYTPMLNEYAPIKGEAKPDRYRCFYNSEKNIWPELLLEANCPYLVESKVHLKP